MYNKEWIVGALAAVAAIGTQGSEANSRKRCQDSVQLIDGALFVEVALMRQAYGSTVFASNRVFRPIGPRALLMVHVDAAFANEVLEISIDALEQEGPPAEQVAHRKAVHLARALVQAVC